jgi:hypothetical protein
VAASFNPPLGDRGQQFVGLLFLRERFVEKLHGIIQAQQFRPGDQRAVAGDLVVLGGLAGGHETGVANGVLVDPLDDLGAA